MIVSRYLPSTFPQRPVLSTVLESRLASAGVSSRLGVMDPDDLPLTPANFSAQHVDVLLRAARHSADLSQRELAQRAGVNRSVVARIEAGLVATPGFGTVVRLLAAAQCGLVVLNSEGHPLKPRDDDDALDAGHRRWPAHLDVRQVESDRDWWHGRLLPGERPLPQFTADWRRLRYKTRVRRTKGESLDEARARARARNTPGGPEVSGADDAGG
jgi:transcriptional regulator with XRE-family HTH domain